MVSKSSTLLRSLIKPTGKSPGMSPETTVNSASPFVPATPKGIITVPMTFALPPIPETAGFLSSMGFHLHFNPFVRNACIKRRSAGLPINPSCAAVSTSM